MRYPITSMVGTTALVFDSPHSGTFYPDDFRPACPLATLRQAEDTHVERLFAFVPDFGAAFVQAHFPRSYIDANRAADEIDIVLLAEPWPDALPPPSSKVRLGKGLIWRLTDDGLPIYDRLLSVAEVQARIDQCWTPYHDAVARAVELAAERHGQVIHINCHSMPSVAASHATEFPGVAHPDIVLGDRDGSTAAPGLTQAVATFLRGEGLEVTVNAPYKGVELVRRHGDPARRRHSLQLEINRRLYMDEATLQPHAGFDKMQGILIRLVRLLEALHAYDPVGA